MGDKVAKPLNISFNIKLFFLFSFAVQRPLLLFVNKVSGQARAEKILFEFAGPLLSFSGCTFDVVNTGMSNILMSICIVYLHSRQLLGANSLFIPKTRPTGFNYLNIY